MPDVVGFPFHIGRDIADDAGLTLANPDPDGPPIGAFAWPGLFYITSQQPSAGAEAYRWDSVAVGLTEHGTADFNAIRGNYGSPADAQKIRTEFLASLGVQALDPRDAAEQMCTEIVESAVILSVRTVHDAVVDRRLEPVVVVP